MDTNTLWVICDTSGGMNEGGKKMLVRNLLTYLDQLARGAEVFPGSLKVVAWGETARLMESEGELSPFRCAGRVSAEGLTATLAQLLEQAGRARLLFLSDGQWPPDELQHLRRWRRARPYIAVRAIAVGAEANRRDLAELAGPSGVFAAEEVWAALEGWDEADMPASREVGRDQGNR